MSKVTHVHKKYGHSQTLSDWKNIYVVSSFAFLDAFQFAFFVWTFWPYVQQVGPVFLLVFCNMLYKAEACSLFRYRFFNRLKLSYILLQYKLMFYTVWIIIFIPVGQHNFGIICRSYNGRFWSWRSSRGAYSRLEYFKRQPWIVVSFFLPFLHMFSFALVMRDSQCYHFSLKSAIYICAYQYEKWFVYVKFNSGHYRLVDK